MQEEQEGEADGDNVTGEKRMKLEMEGEWTRRRKGKSKNKGEKVGSIFSALEVSEAVDSEDDEGFVASQGVVFCATCELDDEEYYPVDADA